MPMPLLPPIEASRLAELERLDILDTEKEPEFQDVMAMASKIAGCPISLVSLVDKDRQWFKTSVELRVADTARGDSFCGHAIEKAELFEVHDAQEDDRFRHNPLVTKEPRIRFYAGQPLVTESGHKIGTLCVIDHVPKKLNVLQKSELQALARVTVRLLEGRIARFKLARELRDMQIRDRALRDANQKLADSQFKLDDSLRKMPVGIAFFEEPDHKFKFTNNAYEQIFGYSGDHSNKAFREVNQAPNLLPLYSILSQVYETGSPVNIDEFQHLLTRPDGPARLYFLQLCVQPQRRIDGTIYGIAVVVVDVTETVLSRERNAQSNRELEEEKSLREKFVDTITHDLRNPLSAARMSAQIFARKVDPTPDIIKTFSQRIIANTDRAEKMIGNLLDANRLKVGKGIPIVTENTCLNSMVTASLETLSTLYGPRFKVKEEASNIQGVWDASALRRVLENLCGNAIKYGSLTTPVIISVGEEANGAFFSVTNQGNPIPENEWESIFLPYTRTESSTSGLQKGWGIGLLLVKGITLAHRGFVAIESSASAGTTFTIHLPLDSSSPHA